MIYHRYYLLTRLISGVEYQIDSEHFQYISISNLNSIKESEIELEKVLLDHSLMVKNVVDYKL